MYNYIHFINIIIYPQLYYGGGNIVDGIAEFFNRRKQRKVIKKYLKIVVEFSNLIQDEKNILIDMVKNNFPTNEINKQYNYVNRLCLKQKDCIRDLLLEESKCQDEIYKRFYYFKEKRIRIYG